MPVYNAEKYLKEAVSSILRQSFSNFEFIINDGSIQKSLEIIKRYKRFIPSISKAKMIGVLQGPRMVKSQSDKHDENPSIIRSYNDSYFTVFSGKIDHSTWVADDLVSLIKG